MKTPAKLGLPRWWSDAPIGESTRVIAGLLFTGDRSIRWSAGVHGRHGVADNADIGLLLGSWGSCA